MHWRKRLLFKSRFLTYYSNRSCFILLIRNSTLRRKATFRSVSARGPGAVLHYKGFIDMCGPEGYGFSAILVIVKASIFAL